MQRDFAKWALLGVFVGGGLNVTAGCGDDEGTAADRIGIAAECSADVDCPEVRRGDETIQLACIRAFRGGYCGIADCQQNDDCPDGAACVNHTDGRSYCFRLCLDKAECNRNRTSENEANCSSNITFAEATPGKKACVPPSSGG
jgi:hypothetical protein